jgi:hypothetical protein
MLIKEEGADARRHRFGKPAAVTRVVLAIAHAIKGSPVAV